MLHGQAGNDGVIARTRRRMHHQHAADIRAGGEAKGRGGQILRRHVLADRLVVAQIKAGTQHGIARQPPGADGGADDRQVVAANGRARDSVSAAASRSSSRFTHSTPARRNAASNARSAAAVGVHHPQAGADRHHRPQLGGGACGGQEQPMVLDPADVQQDRAGVRVARQPVQHHAVADVVVVADADDMAEANSVRLRPVDHRAADGGGLRHQRKPPGRRLDVRARGIEAELSAPRGRRNAVQARGHRCASHAPEDLRLRRG